MTGGGPMAVSRLSGGGRTGRCWNQVRRAGRRRRADRKEDRRSAPERRGEGGGRGVARAVVGVEGEKKRMRRSVVGSFEGRENRREKRAGDGDGGVKNEVEVVMFT
ncbi:uncharacterized protein A4U43_C03F32030 [Asparagus officinalis]|uniref:Uncharacterized protein n=1 Tax=Asparagus officinalis TaxID=4686 RepID=A0A5P1FEJ1_ASPOF|nr:uncharacterized protein A4U43_C03F32030 [Asparagus officinalis]